MTDWDQLETEIRERFGEYDPDASYAKCPYCGEWFRGLPLTDPIRKHVDFCESKPEDSEDD